MPCNDCPVVIQASTTDQPRSLPSDGWINIRGDTGKLLARFHQRKHIIEFKVSGKFFYTNLDEYLESQAPSITNNHSNTRIATGLLSLEAN